MKRIRILMMLVAVALINVSEPIKAIDLGSASSCVATNDAESYCMIMGDRDLRLPQLRGLLSIFRQYNGKSDLCAALQHCGLSLLPGKYLKKVHLTSQSPFLKVSCATVLAKATSASASLPRALSARSLPFHALAC